MPCISETALELPTRMPKVDEPGFIAETKTALET